MVWRKIEKNNNMCVESHEKSLHVYGTEVLNRSTKYYTQVAIDRNTV